jgi:flagellar hook-associated protein 3 FlgL
MRITSSNAFESSLLNLQRRQESLSEAQNRLTLGKRVLRASDDPTAAARAERSLATVHRTEANQRALEASRRVMQQTEVALGDATDLMQAAREHIVSAGNASYSDAERQTVATALRGLRTQLLSVANRNDGSGGYLFGGQGAASAPFVDAPAGVEFRGTTGFLRAATDEPLPLSVDGRSAWMGALNPTTPGGPDISLFELMDRTINELETTGRSNADVIATVHRGLEELDAVMSNVLGWRARAGEALHRADSMEERLSQVRLGAENERSEAEDLDMTRAISEFQSQQTGYDAALKTYAIVQRMSLFDYLGN